MMCGTWDYNSFTNNMPLNYASCMAVTLSNEFIPLNVMISLFTTIPCIITGSLCVVVIVTVYNHRVTVCSCHSNSV